MRVFGILLKKSNGVDGSTEQGDKIEGGMQWYRRSSSWPIEGRYKRAM